MAVDTLDIITTAEARTAINVSSGHTDQLEQFVTAVSRRIDELCGPVVARSVTECHSGSGASRLRPQFSPVSSVTTLKEWDGAATLTTLSADTWGQAGNTSGYYLHQSTTYGHDCWIERRTSGTRTVFASGPAGNVQLVYSAGRYASTAAVDARFKMAAGAVLRRLWDREAGAWARGADPFDQTPGSRFFEAVMHVVKEQLADEMRPVPVA